MSRFEAVSLENPGANCLGASIAYFEYVPTVRINCDDLGWGFKLLSQLNNHEEVTLIYFDYSAHGKLCEETAVRFGMQTEHDAKAKIFRFLKSN